MLYTLAADAVVAFHVAYVGFVIVGQFLILAGVVLKWAWVRNLWFRLAHLLAIIVVAAEALSGIACPLTIWEDSLRQMGGQAVTDGTFIGRFMHSILFYDLEPWVFTTCYVAFALLVLATMLFAPPRLS